jgi:hypothetical protein
MLQPLQVVFGMLPELMFCRKAIKTVSPPGIVKGGRGQFLPAIGVHQHRTNGIRSKIHSYDKCILFHLTVALII